MATQRSYINIHNSTTVKVSNAYMYISLHIACVRGRLHLLIYSNKMFIYISLQACSTFVEEQSRNMNLAFERGTRNMPATQCVPMDTCMHGASKKTHLGLATDVQSGCL